MYKTLLILACLIFLSPHVYAHPPSDINLSYNKDSQTLTLTVNHYSVEKGHYIRMISLKLNDEELQSKTYSFQNSKRIVSFSFPVPEHEPQDVLSIEVTCNRTGPVNKDFSIDKIIGQN